MDPTGLIYAYAIDAAVWTLVGTGYLISEGIKKFRKSEKDSKLVYLVKPLETVKKD